MKRVGLALRIARSFTESDQLNQVGADDRVAGEEGVAEGIGALALVDDQVEAALDAAAGELRRCEPAGPDPLPHPVPGGTAVDPERQDAVHRNPVRRRVGVSGLDRRAAVGAGLAEAPVHGHLGVEGGDLLGEAVADVGAQPLDRVEGTIEGLAVADDEPAAGRGVADELVAWTVEFLRGLPGPVPAPTLPGDEGYVAPADLADRFAPGELEARAQALTFLGVEAKLDGLAGDHWGLMHARVPKR